MSTLPQGISSILKNLGLAESEIAVMLFLIQSATGLRATEIARKTKINRSTLYGILKNLADRGLVSSSEENGVMRFCSIEPELLITYIERAQEKLASDAKQMTELLPAIARARKTHEGYYPQIQYFGGIEGIKQAYEDMIKNNPEKETYGFIDFGIAFETMGSEWPEYFIKKRAAAGVHSYVIASDTKKSHEVQTRDAKERRIIKFFPEGYNFGLEILTYSGKTLITSFDKEHPLAIIINDEKIANTMKTLFRYVDDTLPNQN